MSRVVPTSQIKQWSNEQGSLYCVNSDSAIKCRLMLRRYIIYLDFQVSYKQQQTEKKKKEKKRKEKEGDPTRYKNRSITITLHI